MRFTYFERILCCYFNYEFYNLGQVRLNRGEFKPSIFQNQLKGFQDQNLVKLSLKLWPEVKNLKNRNQKYQQNFKEQKMKISDIVL